MVQWCRSWHTLKFELHSWCNAEDFSADKREYRRYRGIIDNNRNHPADVLADVADDLDDVFAQEAPWKEDGGSPSIGDDRSVFTTALARLPKTVPRSGFDFSNVVKGLLYELERSQAGSAETEKEVKRQRKLVLKAKKVKRDGLDSFASLP